MHFTSCVDDELQAENSFEGAWNVTEIFSLYGEFFPTGFNPSSNLTEEGALGYFNFSENKVAYSFTRNDTLYSGNMYWKLDVEKRRTGFVIETFFKLTIEDEFIFDAVFGDSTNSSENNARFAVLTSEAPTSGNGVLISLSLEKE
jgi:hypothetical protein|tara:strand:- start:639 stop:1073 length:435 start_codon:yes stop_codon:yes gene_type:complete